MILHDAGLQSRRAEMDSRAKADASQARFAVEAIRKVQAMYAASESQLARRKQAYSEAPSEQLKERPTRHSMTCISHFKWLEADFETELQDMYQEYMEAHTSWRKRNRSYSHMGPAFSQPPISHSHPFASTSIPIPINVRLYEYLTGRRAYGILWSEETSETFTGSKCQGL